MSDAGAVHDDRIAASDGTSDAGFRDATIGELRERFHVEKRRPAPLAG